MGRRRFLAAGGVVALGGIAGAGLLVRGGSAGTDADATSSPATSIVAVEQRDLVTSDAYEGSLGYGEARSYAGERAGVVTSVAEAGSTVQPGSALFGVDAEPTVLLAGAVPAYRALDADSSDGPDVAQLEQALVDLGFGADLTVDEDFTSATATAVEAWEESLGREEPDGTVEEGDVVFAPGAVRVATVSADVGTRVEAGTAVLDATATTRVVTLDLEAAQGSDLEPGTKVQIALPDGTETTGTVASVGSEEQASSSASSDDQGAPAAATGDTGETTVPVEVTLDDPGVAAGFDSGGVDVSIERSRHEGALVVPVTALVALAEGGYALQVADDAEPAGYRLVAITVDGYSDGYAAVSSDAIEPGIEVVVPA